METLEQRIARVIQDEVAIVAYHPAWVQRFADEKAHLLACLPADLIRRIEHFGSTAVPGLAAKPIVDILVEVTDLEETRLRIAPILESQGYDYFWRPTHGDDVPPFYAWFIKRDPETAARTHHIHMLEASAPFAGHWDRLLFRDYLIEHPEVAREYERLKIRLAAESPRDRIAYTRGKTEFIEAVTRRAKAAAGAAPAIALEPFREAHLVLLEAWLRRPHVAPWYPDPERDLALASAPPLTGSHSLITEEGRPVGYLRWQRVDRATLDELGLHEIPAGSIDVDILIGEIGSTARGLGPIALELLATRLLADPGVALLGLTTSVENRRAHRAFRKAGFEIARQYDPNGFGPCHLMVRDLRTERRQRT